MEDANPQAQQQQMMLQQQLLLQQLQHQRQQAMSRFPSNVDSHLGTSGANSPSLNASSHHQFLNLNPNLSSNPNPNMERTIGNNQMELKLAYEDAWKVCHPDFKREFGSVEDACERLLPYHVVADYEAEEDEQILDSDTTGQMLSRMQQWDNTIATRLANFTGSFEKQAHAFSLIYKRRGHGEFRSEERLMIERALLQEENHALLELRAEIETREKAVFEAKNRMAAMSQAQSQQVHAEMMARGALRIGALGSRSNDGSMGHGMGEEEHGRIPVGNGWGHNSKRNGGSR